MQCWNLFSQLIYCSHTQFPIYSVCLHIGPIKCSFHHSFPLSFLEEEVWKAFDFFHLAAFNASRWQPKGTSGTRGEEKRSEAKWKPGMRWHIKCGTLVCWPNHLASSFRCPRWCTLVVPTGDALTINSSAKGNHEHAFNSLCLGNTHRWGWFAARILQLIDTIGQPIDPAPAPAPPRAQLRVAWTI